MIILPASTPAEPSTRIVPELIAVPLAPTSCVTPPSSIILPASTRLGALTTSFIISVTWSEGIKTIPGVEPSGGVDIAKFTRPSPSKFTAKLSAAPILTFPIFATIKPSFETRGATKTAYPLSFIIIFPLFII